MNLTIDIDEFNDNNIIFMEPVKNTVMDDSNFIRILYSNSLFTLSGIFIKIKLNLINMDKYFNKFKCSFEISKNKYIIDKLSLIESNILEKININKKIPCKKIQEQLNSGNIKLFTEMISNTIPELFIIKISGIWETEFEYGITYKFIDISSHQLRKI